MTTKSTALQIADSLEKNGEGCTCCAYASFECCCEAVWGSDYTREAAAELRRLHAENEQLRNAVIAEREACAKVCDGWTHANGDDCAEAIRARNKT